MREEFLNEYNSSINSIWGQLISFSSRMIILDKIMLFKFNLFDDTPNNLFWPLLINSFFESSILCIWRISIDNSSDGITLQQLKNKINQNILSVEVKDDFKKKIKEINFKNSLKQIWGNVEKIRHNYIAHFNFQNYNSPSQSYTITKMEFDELKLAHKQIVSYFDLLCFGSKKNVYTIDYDPNVIYPEGIDNRIDIEYILDLIAKESYFIKGNESIKEIWQADIDMLSESDLAEINKYRIKFNYPILQKTA